MCRRYIFGLLLLAPALVRPQADDPDRRFWNRKFSDPQTQFRHEPSTLLVEAIRGRKPGAAIDLGMGQGRNALYLAAQGWRMTGVDLSDVAVAQAKEQAARLGLPLDALTDNVDHFDIGKERWDLIALFYMHAWYHGAKPSSTRRLKEALKPGGLLVVEGFAGEPDFMFHTNELLRDFADLRILRYEDTQAEAEWDPGRQSRVIRLIAEKSR